MSVPGVTRAVRFGESPVIRAATSTPGRPPSRYVNDCSVSISTRPAGIIAFGL